MTATAQNCIRTQKQAATITFNGIKRLRMSWLRNFLGFDPDLSRPIWSCEFDVNRLIAMSAEEMVHNFADLTPENASILHAKIQSWVEEHPDLTIIQPFPTR